MDTFVPSPAAFALLCGAALAAGFVDAIAGGGGVLTVPALFASGMPPHLALGTNKAQSVVGTLTALARFARAGLVDPQRAVPAFVAAFLGALAGTRLVLWISPALLRPVAVVLLLAVAGWLTLRRELHASDVAPPPSPRLRAALIAFCLGCYDGFFGPGTGTFLVVLHAKFLRDPLDRASANAKVANVASNLGALALFLLHGSVLWRVALPMAVAQSVGGWIGSNLAIRHGGPLVRRIVLIVVVLLVGKLLFDLSHSDALARSSFNPEFRRGGAVGSADSLTLGWSCV